MAVAVGRAFRCYPAGMLAVAIVARHVRRSILNEVMRAIPVLLLLCAAACAADPTPTEFTDGGEDVPAESGRTYRWSFEGDAPGALPDDFIRVLGDWRVDEGALAQLGEFEDPDFPRVLIRDLTFTDFVFRARCRAESGETDQVCGLLFRATDSENYFITRANVLESNLRLYRVIDGDRQQLASVDLAWSAGDWHQLEVTARGTSIAIAWDGEVKLEAEDSSFARGKLGLWTKADSISRFDDLEATAD